jgi:hypothetical protein
MSKNHWRFSPTEIKRAVRSVTQLGLRVKQVEIALDGTIRLDVSEPTEDHDGSATTDNPWDQVLAK